MGFSFGSPSKTANNQTVNNADNRQQDNKVAADGNSVVKSTAGGALNDQTGAIIAGERSSITLNSVDPGSYTFASDVARAAIGSATAGNQAIAALASGTSTTTAKLAQGSPIGTDWKGLLLPIAAIVAVLGFLMLNRKKAHA